VSIRDVIRGNVFAEIDAERDRQETRWGEQNHPMTGARFPRGNDKNGRNAREIVARYFGIPTEEEAKRRCEDEHKAGRGTYVHIAVEELAEFVAACVQHGNTSPEARAELVQLTAVCVAMAEAIDRRRLCDGPETRAAGWDGDGCEVTP
jgi:hypothetical protein